MKSTPINEMESLGGLKSLEEQRQEKIMLQAEKYKRLQRHPMHTQNVWAQQLLYQTLKL